MPNGPTGCWCFCVEHLLGPTGSDSSNRGRNWVDYKTVLSEEDFAVFVKLRDLRKEIPAEQAIPVYAVCTNEQLAEMAKTRCATAADCNRPLNDSMAYCRSRS